MIFQANLEFYSYKTEITAGLATSFDATSDASVKNEIGKFCAESAFFPHGCSWAWQGATRVAIAPPRSALYTESVQAVLVSVSFLES